MTKRLALITLTAFAIGAAHAEPARPYEGEYMVATPYFTRLAPDSRATEIVDFWQNAGPALWFAKDADFDRRFREQNGGRRAASETSRRVRRS